MSTSTPFFVNLVPAHHIYGRRGFGVTPSTNNSIALWAYHEPKRGRFKSDLTTCVPNLPLAVGSTPKVPTPSPSLSPLPSTHTSSRSTTYRHRQCYPPLFSPEGTCLAVAFELH